MKRIVITLFLLANAVLGFAQQKNTSNFEIGGGINAYGILGACGGPIRYFGPGAYFEYRNAFAEHFDVGAQLNYKRGDGESAFIGDGAPGYDIKYNQIGLKAVADYNVCPSRLASPYFGVGLGVGELYEKTGKGTKHNEMYGTLCPRIGVQVWRIRLAIEVDFAYNGEYGFLSTPTSTALNIGFTF